MNDMHTERFKARWWMRPRWWWMHNHWFDPSYWETIEHSDSTPGQDVAS